MKFERDFVIVEYFSMQTVEESRASLCSTSPRTLVDSLALSIYKVRAIVFSALPSFILYQASPSNARSFCTPAAPRQKLRHAAFVAPTLLHRMHLILSFCSYNVLLMHKVSA